VNDRDPEALLEPILALHQSIRDAVLESCATQEAEALARVAGDAGGDTTYAIDAVAGDLLVRGLAVAAVQSPLCLIAEGIKDAILVLPRGAKETDCKWRVIIDPIDGTRGLMYQKRSAWILTGVAPNRGSATRLSDIVLAVQTEIPLLKQHLSDQVWAIRGRGAEARRYNRLTGAHAPLVPRPSLATTIEHGFAGLVRFFPGARDVLGAVDDEIAREVLGAPPPGRAATFEDQYMSTGGQLYELMAGHDRFIADLRPLVTGVLKSRGLPPGLCCHPYDICTALIAQELGVQLTGAHGEPLNAPFDTTTDVAWAGYANADLRAAIEPALRLVLIRHHLGSTR
jgi:fructose-1,6-bisphosphatase/inositol monophosphatase family enzyme